MTTMHLEQPEGEVSFFFTDVEGSTGLWERDPIGMEAALAEHDRRLRAAIDAHGGYIFTTAGDSFAVAFRTPIDAVEAALDAQLGLIEPCAGVPIRVRMGIHTGTATGRDGDYFGSVVNRSARLMSAGHGGQILLSGTTVEPIHERLPTDVGLVDLGEHRLKDLLHPVQIFQLRHPALTDRFAPLKTLTGPASNLPIQLTSFVGRDRELAVADELLRAHRQLTLTGPGGAGKTRLALQLAAESVEEFPEGLRLVELAPVSDPEMAYDAVATTLGVHATPVDPLVETIAAEIGDKRMLLIVDNCEHMLEPVHLLSAHLLRHCSNLKIVATSRERLGGEGEAVYPVPTMMLPRAPGLESARSSGAVQLFVDRAILARPDFELTDDNIEAVTAICRRLDGIPLAIELAAARVRVLAPRQIADRLDERFRLLGTSDRSRSERHRTLAATIGWSYDHLSRAEQAVFRRASVFSGDFSMDAAEDVCSGGLVDRWDVLDLVSALVDQSMLVPEDAPDGEVRYRLLESMRHYGRSLWTDPAGEPDDAARTVQDRHAAHFLALAADVQRTQRSGQVAEAVAAFAADVENVRTALRHLLDTNQTVDAARLIGAIGYLWYVTGAFREGVEWCRELFAHDLDLPDEVLASSLHAYSLVLGSWAQPEAGAEMLRRQVQIRRRLGDPARLAAALNNLGNLLNDLGHFEEAGDVLREAIDAFRTAGEHATLALVSLSHAARERGDYVASTELCAEALRESSGADDPYGSALAQGGLGEARLHLGQIEQARELIVRSRDGFERLGVAPGVAYSDLLLGLAAVKRDDPVVAARHLIDALADVDGHWYLASKFWIVLLTAGLAPDRSTGAVLLGAALHHDNDSAQRTPAWVVAHRATVIRSVESELGIEPVVRCGERGREMTARDAVAMTTEILRSIIDSDDTEDTEHIMEPTA